MEIVIPTGIDNTLGFHLECYRKFVSLSVKQRKLFAADKESVPAPPEQKPFVAFYQFLWHETRRVHATTFDELKRFVHGHVIVNNEAHFIK